MPMRDKAANPLSVASLRAMKQWRNAYVKTFRCKDIAFAALRGCSEAGTDYSA